MKNIKLANAILFRIEKEMNLFYMPKISDLHHAKKNCLSYYVNQLFLLNYAEKFFNKKNILEDILTQISLYRNVYVKNLKQIVLDDFKIPAELIISHGFMWNRTTQGVIFWDELDKEFKSFIYKTKENNHYLTDIIK